MEARKWLNVKHCDTASVTSSTSIYSCARSMLCAKNPHPVLWSWKRPPCWYCTVFWDNQRRKYINVHIIHTKINTSYINKLAGDNKNDLLTDMETEENKVVFFGYNNSRTGEKLTRKRERESAGRVVGICNGVCHCWTQLDFLLILPRFLEEPLPALPPFLGSKFPRPSTLLDMGNSTAEGGKRVLLLVWLWLIEYVQSFASGCQTAKCKYKELWQQIILNAMLL